MIKKIFKTLIVSVLFFTQTLFAANTPETERTIMIYIVASDLESFGENATFNIHQILKANFSKDEKVKVVVMTGGTWEWYLAGEYLYDPDNPAGPTEVSAEYNQIWEAKGADSVTYQENGHGKLVLLDRDGISGDGVNAKTSMEEFMSDPNTLKAFINYSVEHFPAKKYGLVLWNHGGGVIDGYGLDEHSIDPLSEIIEFKMMSFAEILDALSDNDVIRTVGKFDFVNFDACLMNSVELNLALADLTNYYIASAETEPSYGQDYNGWLNALGENPTIDTFELGKVVVDDFMKFYEELHEDHVTLAVVDMNKLMNSNFVSALTEMNTILKREVNNKSADGSFLYYDELNTVDHAVHYSTGEETKRDIGNVAARLPIITKEVSANSIDENGVYTLLNGYSDSSKKIAKVLGDSSIIYSRTSDDYSTEATPYLDENGEIQYGVLNSSGMYIFFPAMRGVVEMIEYYHAITDALPYIQNQERREFLSSYVMTALDYTLLTESGHAVATLINNGVQKNEINFNKVKEYWQRISVSNGDKFWNYAIAPLIQARGEAATIAWLEEIIAQQKGDAVSVDNVTVKKIIGRTRDGYQIEINDTDKRIVENVNVNTKAEVTASLQYFMTFFGADYPNYLSEVGLGLSEVNAIQDTSGLHRDLNDPIEKLLSDYLKWYTERNSIWNYIPEEEKTYAIKDSDGNLHAANVKFDNTGQAIVDAQFMDDSIPNYPAFKRSVTLYFAKDGDNYKLTKFAFLGGRPTTVEDLQQEMKELKMVYNMYFHGIPLTPPLSNTTFTVTKDNAASIKLVEVNVDELNDIGDIDGDGEKIQRKAVVKDMYYHEVDISEKLKAAENDDALFNIDLADVESVTYNGQEQGPRVVHNGKVLQENVDYTFNWSYDTGACVNVGPCQVMLIGKGKYASWKTVNYEILQKETTPTISFASEKYVYNGQEQTPEIIVKDGETVIPESNYTVTYADGRKDVGTYRVSVELKENYRGSAEATFEISPKEITPTVILSNDAFVYNGQERTPEVVVKDGEAELTGTDYTVRYTAGRINVGTYGVIVELAGNYQGSAAVTFDINPKGTAYRGLWGGRNSIIVNWKRQKTKMSDSRITGYQIQVATNKTFTKEKRLVTLKGFKKNTRRIVRLKANKKYFVHVRTYKVVNKRKYFSRWTKTRAVQTMK